MFDEELETQKKTPKLKGLEPMSIDELNNYIQEMTEEIERVKQEIGRKNAHMDAASSFFKT